MAKRSNRTGATAGQPDPWPLKTPPKAEQLNRMIEVMETVCYHRVECFLCFKRISIRDTTEVKAAREVYDAGWRWICLKGEAGLACGECVINPDGI